MRFWARKKMVRKLSQNVLFFENNTFSVTIASNAIESMYFRAKMQIRKLRKFRKILVENDFLWREKV